MPTTPRTAARPSARHQGKSIGEIRDVLDRAGWLRNDYAGHTPAEFKRANVGERLTAMIAELQALVIAPRFAHEAERRAHEIASCRDVVARWEARDMGSLASAVIVAIPTSAELAALTDEQIETLRKYGNTYDNTLYLTLARRRSQQEQQP